MVSGNNSCFQGPQGMPNYGAVDNMISSSSHTVPESESHSNALLYNLSLLREKVQQVQSLVDVVIFPDQGQEDSVGIAVAGVGTLIQEIIVTASSLMYTCQKMALDATVHRRTDELHQRPNKVSDDGESSSQPRIEEIDHVFPVEEGRRAFFSSETIEGYHDNQDYSGNNDDENQLQHGVRMNQELHNFSSMNCDVIELDASDLLAKYTHYCQVCGKGFKRDANLRMHMRAHGDQYKSKSALSNPIKNSNNSTGYKNYLSNSPRKYSCPQEGCRWNKKHAKFQPLKSMICVKNHYKRSHCPKMYVCNRCNQKQFSLLSDLRTHEKHCGDLKWQCSCGTTFSRKDKLMGHVSLFIGHAPAMNCIMSETKFDSQ